MLGPKCHSVIRVVVVFVVMLALLNQVTHQAEWLFIQFSHISEWLINQWVLDSKCHLVIRVIVVVMLTLLSQVTHQAEWLLN